MSLLYFFAYPWLAFKYKRGFDERRGIYSQEFKNSIKDGHPLWIHAVSVGEVQSALPFIDQVLSTGFDRPLVLSTTTTTGREMAEKLLSDHPVLLFYYPWDVPGIVKRAIESISPCGYVMVETEIWPQMLSELKNRNIPSFLLNGRFSDKSFEKRKAGKFFWKKVLDLYTLIMVRERDDKDKLISLGVDAAKILLTGDCKVDALLYRSEGLDLSSAREAVGNVRPLFVAGSTHIGEDEVVLEAFGLVKKKERNAGLLLVPRHPERAPAVLELARKYGRTVLLSQQDPKKWDIMVVDRIGWLFDLYSLADAAFVGGSLVPKGGQNILEPALFGVPVMHGPHMEDFREASATLDSTGVACSISNAPELAEKWLDLLDPLKRAEVKSKSRVFFDEVSGAAKVSWSAVKKHLK